MKTVGQFATNPYAEERAIQSESGRLKREQLMRHTFRPRVPVQKRVKPPMEMNLPGLKPIRFSDSLYLRNFRYGLSPVHRPRVEKNKNKNKKEQYKRIPFDFGAKSKNQTFRGS